VREQSERYYTGYGARLAVLKGKSEAGGGEGPQGGTSRGGQPHWLPTMEGRRAAQIGRGREVSFVLLLLLLLGCRCCFCPPLQILGGGEMGCGCPAFLAESCLSLRTEKKSPGITVPGFVINMIAIASLGRISSS
jgi:hypothetical protein